MMKLFLCGSYMLVLFLLYCQLTWIRKEVHKYLYRGIVVGSFILLVILLCRFALPYDKLQHEILRRLLGFSSAFAILWFALLSAAQGIVYLIQRFHHTKIKCLYVILLVGACSISSMVYGGIHAGELNKTTYQISLHKPMKHEKTIALLSDLHL